MPDSLTAVTEGWIHPFAPKIPDALNFPNKVDRKDNCIYICFDDARLINEIFSDYIIQMKLHF